MTQTIEQATAWIAKTIGGTVEDVLPHPDGGWTFEAKHVAAYGSSLVEEHDSFHYCLLDTENDEEVGRHREVMMFTRTDAGSGATLLLEGLYSRALGDTRPSADAVFDGRIALAGRDDAERMKASFSESYSDRMLEHQLCDFSYTSQGLRTLLYHRKVPLGDDLRRRLIAETTELNRAVNNLLELGHAA